MYPTDDEIKAWAARERQRREQWAKGPSPEQAALAVLHEREREYCRVRTRKRPGRSARRTHSVDARCRAQRPPGRRGSLELALQNVRARCVRLANTRRTGLGGPPEGSPGVARAHATGDCNCRSVRHQPSTMTGWRSLVAAAQRVKAPHYGQSTCIHEWSLVTESVAQPGRGVMWCSAATATCRAPSSTAPHEAPGLWESRSHIHSKPSRNRRSARAIAAAKRPRKTPAAESAPASTTPALLASSCRTSR